MANSDLLSNLNSSNYPTITECINDAKNNKFDISNISTKLICENHLFIDESLLFKYHDVLSQYLNTYKLEYENYYLPQAVSLELYGTTDLWYTILYFNNMSSVFQFHNVKTIKALSTQGIQQLNKIIENESYLLELNEDDPFIAENITLKKVII